MYVLCACDIYAYMGCVVYMYTCMLGMHAFCVVYVHGLSGLYVFVRVTYIIYFRVVCMYVCKHGIQVRVVWYGMVCVIMCGVYVCKSGTCVC